MANDWDSKYAIWRDLSVAQGREVPAQINTAVAYNERPPPLACNEETEEEFFADYAGGGDLNSAGPDLDLIQKMLYATTQVSEPLQESPRTNSPEIIKKIKKPKNKNVAILSLLKMYDQSLTTAAGDNASIAEELPATTPVLSTASMFKKKSKPKSKSPEASPSPVISVSDTDSEVSSYRKEFVPSLQATKYFNKFCKQSEAIERAQETVWTLAEKKMIEIDRNRKLSALSPGEESSSPDPSVHGMDSVRLPIERHQFTDKEDCVVCQVLCKWIALTQTNTELK